METVEKVLIIAEEIKIIYLALGSQKVDYLFFIIYNQLPRTWLYYSGGGNEKRNRFKNKSKLSQFI